MVIEKIFLSPETYLDLLEEYGGIVKTSEGNIWGEQTPIKYENYGVEKVPMLGDIPLFIDSMGPEWAIVWGEE